MAFGLRLINDYDEQIADEGAMHYLTDQGLCQNDFVLRNRSSWAQTPCQSAYPQNVKDTFGDFLTPIADLTSLFFYELPPQGIRHSLTFEQRYTNLQRGLVPVIETFGEAAPVAFKRVTPAPPDTNLTETHGLRIRDAFGNIAFDSRRPAYAVWDSFVVSEADLRTLLFNGTPISLTFRTPITKAWVHIPFMTARATFVQNGTLHDAYPVLRQIDDQSLQIQRELRDTGRTTGRTLSWAHTVIIFVGK